MNNRITNYYFTLSYRCRSLFSFYRFWSSFFYWNQTIDLNRILGIKINIRLRYRARKLRIFTQTISSIDRVQINYSSNERLRPMSILFISIDLLNLFIIHLQHHHQRWCYLRYFRRCHQQCFLLQQFSLCQYDVYTKATFSIWPFLLSAIFWSVFFLFIDLLYKRKPKKNEIFVQTVKIRCVLIYLS